VHGDGAVLLDLGKCLFLDGSDYHVVAARAGGIEHQEGKLAIAGDESETGVHGSSSLIDARRISGIIRAGLTVLPGVKRER
jgi:hypothetical protein